ncbi:MAG TPA: hypothetical protein VFA07_05985 [Chthonomonadaceae bacterium]|nr:hypothetical protein [Chthonomonadaceae bacterium]
MKMRILALGGLMTLLGTTATLGVLAQGNGVPRPVPGVIVRGAHPFRQGRERHPELRQALRALMRAKMELQEGAHDFGGHRADALKATDQAIQQVRLALKFDKD